MSGPTEAMEVRRLMEINTTPRIRKAWEEGLDKGTTKYEVRNLKLMSNTERPILNVEVGKTSLQGHQAF
jgi:hypothetical protein